jgi:hypothetical protein
MTINKNTATMFQILENPENKEENIEPGAGGSLL